MLSLINWTYIFCGIYMTWNVNHKQRPSICHTICQNFLWSFQCCAVIVPSHISQNQKNSLTNLFMHKYLYLFFCTRVGHCELYSNSGNEKDKFDFDYGVAFLNVIECAMRCIPCENIDSFTVVDKEVAHMTPLGWEYFTGASGIMEIIQDCLRRWIVELSRNDQISPKHYHLNIVASCFKLLSTFVKRFSRSILFKPVTFLNTLDEIIKHINTYMYQSKFWSNLISKTNELSIFSEQDGKDGRIRDPNNLPSLGVIR